MAKAMTRNFRRWQTAIEIASKLNGLWKRSSQRQWKTASYVPMEGLTEKAIWSYILQTSQMRMFTSQQTNSQTADAMRQTEEAIRKSLETIRRTDEFIRRATPIPR
jgi:Zn-dependent M32 family carboxypeptidase